MLVSSSVSFLNVTSRVSPGETCSVGPTRAPFHGRAPRGEPETSIVWVLASRSTCRNFFLENSCTGSVSGRPVFGVHAPLGAPTLTALLAAGGGAAFLLLLLLEHDATTRPTTRDRMRTRLLDAIAGERITGAYTSWRD